MAWTIRYAKVTQKEARKIDPESRRRIRQYLEERVAGLADPRELGSPLQGNLTGLWRYRVGHYRLICEIRDEELVVLAVRIGHRKEVYR